MEKQFTFNKSGRDVYIDFIKAYAILCVLVGHALPGFTLDYIAYGFWAGMQVPLFVLVQSFHYFKKESTPLNIRKIFKRIFLPFLVIQFFLLLSAIIVKKEDLSNTLIHFALLGGYGPGAYFPWVYIQIAMILPFAGWLINRIPRQYHFVTVLLICEGFEVLLSFVDFPDRLYRLLAIRYLFLIYLGYLWVKDGIKWNKRTILLSLLSLAFVAYFNLWSGNTEPFFYHTSWSYHRWPCYYYVAVLGGVFCVVLVNACHEINLLRKQLLCYQNAVTKYF